MILLAGLSTPAKAQAAPQAEKAGAQQGQAADAADEEPAQAPKKRLVRLKPAEASEKPDPMKGRLMEIAKVFKNQIAFGSDQYEAWKTFWTKMRDERGRFEVRLAKQREDFVDSMRSLDAKDRGQGLADFETMQGNVMRSFEDNQGGKIKDFVGDLQNKLREFGAAQEAERARLADSSEEAWAAMKSSLDIQAPAPSKDKKDGKKDKKKDKKS